jgi:hypothetical protein
MLMPGAIRSDVKGIAMGAARTKGWAILKSTDDLLVVQRPLDPVSPTAQALGAAGSLIPPKIEVTSAFVERADGVNVALGAELVSQPPGEKAPKRTDITETYRGELTQSLESLRSNWSANRQRVATALPPAGAQSEPPPGTAATADPLVRSWAETVEEEKAAKARGGAAPVAAPAAAPVAAPIAAQAPPPARPEGRSVAEARPTPAPEPAPRPVAPPAPEPARAAAPASPPRAGSGTGPAPVVDGSGAVAGGARSASSRTSLQSGVLPPAPAETVPPEKNMLTLSAASGTGAWAYHAEQYARLRGCTVADQGSILIESRADGEIHKVPCMDSDSYLLKCQNGVCRGLE